jgi:hypothetical protein
MANTVKSELAIHLSMDSRESGGACSTRTIRESMNASAWDMSLIGDGNRSENDGNKQAGVIKVDRIPFFFMPLPLALAQPRNFSNAASYLAARQCALTDAA